MLEVIFLGIPCTVLIFTLLLSVIGVMFAIGVSVILLTLSSLLLLAVGITSLFSQTALGIAFIGGSLILLGLGILLAIPTILLICRFIPWSYKASVFLSRKMFIRREPYAKAN